MFLLTKSRCAVPEDIHRPKWNCWAQTKCELLLGWSINLQTIYNFLTRENKESSLWSDALVRNDDKQFYLWWKNYLTIFPSNRNLWRFLGGNDIFVNLPTGFGKSFIFRCLQIVADIVHSKPKHTYMTSA